MDEILIRLNAIEHQLNFYREAYIKMHNEIVKGTYIKINDGPFKEMCIDFFNMLKDLKCITEELRNESIVGTMTFMAKQIHEIQKELGDINKEGIKKKIHLELTMDGYEMVKKISDKRSVENETPENITKMLMDTLPDREAKALIHRYALSGGEKKTFAQIASLFGVSTDRARQICMKALRTCRHPSRRELVKNLTHTELRKDIIGE